MESVEITGPETPRPQAPPAVTQLRERIDAVDDALLRLMLERIELSSRVMKQKSPSHVVDSAREQAIIQRYFEQLAMVSTPAKVERLVRGIIGAARLYPE